MGLVAYDQVPIGDFQLFLQFFIPGQFIQAGNTIIDLGEGISGHAGFQAIIGEDFKAQVEFLV